MNCELVCIEFGRVGDVCRLPYRFFFFSFWKLRVTSRRTIVSCINIRKNEKMVPTLSSTLVRCVLDGGDDEAEKRPLGAGSHERQRRHQVRTVTNRPNGQTSFRGYTNGQRAGDQGE